MPNSLHMAVTLGVLTLAVAGFVSGKIRNDLVALLALLTLIVTRILTPQEAFSGFANSIIFVAAGMFVISTAIVRTGLAGFISNKILAVAGANTHLLYFLVMIIAALTGSMVSNIGTVAIMMPIVVGLAIGINQSPSRFLMPLAYMSSIGGMFTLIGNSPNMVVNDVYVKAGHPSLKLFSFFPVGLICFLFGILVLTPVTSLLLSRLVRRKKDKQTGEAKHGPSLKDLAEKYHLAENLFKVTVPGDSPVVGERLLDLRLPEKSGVMIQEIDRVERQAGYFGIGQAKTVQVAPGPGTVLYPGDTLRVRGSRHSVRAMVEECRLELVGPEKESRYQDKDRFVAIGICELVLMSSSRLVNRKVWESGLRDHFGLTVLSIHRGDKYIWEDIRDQEMLAGDALLVQGSWSSLAKLDEFTHDWVVVGRPKEHAGVGRLREKMPLVAVVLAAMLLTLAFNLVPTVTAVILAAIALVLGGCFKNMDEAYAAINWENLVMISCLLPMALAMEKTGLVDIISSTIISLGSRFGPEAALAVIYAAASGLNIIMSTTPVALLVAPIAMNIAQNLNYHPLPFLFAVATAASMSFASPFSTPANALVMSAGRYTFGDYMRIGLPMQILMGVVMVFALPRLFPF